MKTLFKILFIVLFPLFVLAQTGDTNGYFLAGTFGQINLDSTKTLRYGDGRQTFWFEGYPDTNQNHAHCTNTNWMKYLTSDLDIPELTKMWVKIESSTNVESIVVGFALQDT